MMEWNQLNFTNKFSALPLPRFVASVEINHVETKVTVVLAHATGAGLFRCPTGDSQAPIYDHQDTRTWRHLDTCQFQHLAAGARPALAVSHLQRADSAGSVGGPTWALHVAL